MGLVVPGQLIIGTTLLFFLIQLVFSIIALVDVLKNEFEDNNKIIWVLVILVLWLVGAILYYFIGRKQKLPKSNKLI